MKDAREALAIEICSIAWPSIVRILPSHRFNEALVGVERAIDCWFWTARPEYFGEKTLLAQITVIARR